MGKEVVSFRLERDEREALMELAREQKRAMGELIREAVQEYVDERKLAAWEAEARRTALELGRAALDPDSDEAEMLRGLEAGLDAYASEWIWEDDRG